MTADELLSLSDLRTQFDTDRGAVKAVDGVDLTVREGETVGLVGESGSGKSVTALSAMDLIDSPGRIAGGSVSFRAVETVRRLARRYPKGIATPDHDGYIHVEAGTARDGSTSDPDEVARAARESPKQIAAGDVDGTVHIEAGRVDLTDAPEKVMREIRGGDMGMIFQDPMTSLNPALTVGEQVAESLRLHRYGGRKKDSWFNAVREALSRSGLNEEVREEAVDLLAEVGIPEPAQRVDEHPHEFSGGMRQRVLIAIALACRPQLLIADEPTTALDVTIQAQILDLINDLQDDLGMSVLMITHDLGVVAETCDRVAVMYAGEIVEEGPVEEIFQNPSHPYTYTLLESIPSEDAERLTPIEGNVPDLIDMPEGCHFAPRCPWAKPECTEGDIPFLQHGPGENSGPGAGSASDRGPEEVDHRAKCILDDFDTSEYGTDAGIAATSKTPTGEPILEAKGLKKHFSRADGLLDEWLGGDLGTVKAVDGVDLTVHERETLGLVGESGCGKSTTGRSILRLLEPTDGTVVFAGDDVGGLSKSALRKKRRDMQMIFQDPLSSLDPRQTVAATIAEPLKIHDLPAEAPDDGTSRSDQRRERVTELMEAVGLDPNQRDRYPHEMSGGQRQRVGIARALAVDPDFIVCDEPVSALDVSVQAQILNLMEELQEEFGLTYLFIAHDLSVVRHICDRIAVMYLGEVVEVAATDELFDDPKHPYTRALLSAIPTPDPTVTADRVILSGDVPSPVDPPSGCRFRTRCPSVIPPSDVDIEQETFREVMDFRQRVEEDRVDVAALRDPETPAAAADGGTEASGVTDTATRTDATSVVDDLFETRLTGTNRTTVEKAVEHLLADDREAAAETLRERFETVCERDRPRLQDAPHPAACHLYEQSGGDDDR
ncbi:dipeptide ABC transporter ATP-binding protein [Halomarina rubra]|uniref:Nickel import system ATP-binding protein NikD n=1 Tax=Halomarina rubra TaxID=2071873 RepID=A0ABD6AUF5_9EURY